MCIRDRSITVQFPKLPIITNDVGNKCVTPFSLTTKQDPIPHTDALTCEKLEKIYWTALQQHNDLCDHRNIIKQQQKWTRLPRTPSSQSRFIVLQLPFV